MTGRPRRAMIAAASATARPRRLAWLALGGLICASTILTGLPQANATRFIPWKDPAVPALALSELGGAARTLADYRGCVILLNFWATWCEPCRNELASIGKLHERLAGQPFAVVLINYGEARARVADFAKREAIGFPILLDPNQDAPKA